MKIQNYLKRRYFYVSYTIEKRTEIKVILVFIYILPEDFINSFFAIMWFKIEFEYFQMTVVSQWHDDKFLSFDVNMRLNKSDWERKHQVDGQSPANLFEASECKTYQLNVRKCPVICVSDCSLKYIQLMLILISNISKLSFKEFL